MRGRTWKRRLKHLGRRLRIEQLETRRLLATYVVETTADDGQGSLRQAILDANDNPGGDQITFNIAATNKTIRPLTQLPHLLDPVTIDATTQPGFSGAPVIELSGEMLAGNFSGFTVSADGCIIRGLAIHSFPSAGVFVNQVDVTTIQGNYIGTDIGGISAKPNNASGIEIYFSSLTSVGGSSPGQGNLLSGNLVAGVRIWGQTSVGNFIQGNLIGTDHLGNRGIPNSTGVVIANGASNNVIGRTGSGPDGTGARNIISGNNTNGIDIFGSHENIIAGNWIGISSDDAELSNGHSGVWLRDASHRNLIGGSSVSQRNVISGNHLTGIGISESNETQIHGNLIGTDSNGQSARPNGGTGVLIRDGSQNTIIGGPLGESGNVISGNINGGLRIDNASRNVVQSNLVGISLDGVSKLGNSADGILVSGISVGNIIGTDGDGVSDSSEGNVVSGNFGNGVRLFEASQTIVAGNLIGLTTTGTTAEGNRLRGIRIDGAAKSNRIGTNDDGLSDLLERNIISGNMQQGVLLSDIGTEENSLAGNYIGTDVTGSIALANHSTGVLITVGASGNIVGTSEASPVDSVARNVISGNVGFGVRFRKEATGNSLSGNYVGLDASGQNSIANAFGGFSTFEGAHSNLIGGMSPNQRNFISGNMEWGIRIQPNSGNNLVLGNSIGVAIDGISAVGNEIGGVWLEEAGGNWIGNGTVQGANVIAHNGASGVVITGTAINNVVARTEIYGHSEIGIDLGGDGSTANDETDIDDGPNALLNYPTLSLVASSGTESVFVGEIDTTENAEIRGEFFVDDPLTSAPDGKHFIGFHSQIHSGASGHGHWIKEFPVAVDLGDSISATSYFGLAGSSEFSPTLEVVDLLTVTTDSATITEGNGQIEATVSRGRHPINQSVFISLSTMNPDQLQVPEQVEILPGEMSATFVVGILDDAIYEPEKLVIVTAIEDSRSSAGAIGLTLSDDDIHWHNYTNVFDVNNDGFTAPNDALAIVNRLNFQGSGSLVGIEPPNPRKYFDTNNDSFVSPIDVLLVVNELNSQAEAEGEMSPDGLAPSEMHLDGYLQSRTVDAGEQIAPNLIEQLAHDWWAAKKRRP